MKKLWISAIAGILIQPLVFAGWTVLANLTGHAYMGFPFAEILRLVPAVLLLSAVPIVVLGIPTFWCLNRMKRLNWLSASLSGLVAGCAIGSLLHTSVSDLLFPLVLGAHGLIGAFAFYAAWRRIAAQPCAAADGYAAR